MKIFTIITRWLSIIISLILLGYVLIANTAPFNISTKITLPGSKDLILSPSNRVVYNADSTIKQIDDIVYFNTDMRFKFDQADVKVKFKNNDDKQELHLGYKDQENWHYNTQLLDSPMINDLTWPKLGKGPYLYQKVPQYNSAEELINDTSKNKVIGVYDFDSTNLTYKENKLENYQPSNSQLTIDIPIRGKTIFYTYLENEKFSMGFIKQDINWYADPDVMKISVYRQNDRVFEATIDDDGNEEENKKIGQEQKIEINNPGPELPESGIYKVVVESNGDSILKSISTNMSQIVFEGPIYLVSNKEIYGNIVDSTKENALVTNAKNIFLQTAHNVLQTVRVGEKSLEINEQNKTYQINLDSENSGINIPKSDILLNGSGYFAFDSAQYFEPYPYVIRPIVNKEDISTVDFILTNYPGAPKIDGEWKIAERKFNLEDAELQEGTLNWILKAPGLKSQENFVEYQFIESNLFKEGWYKK